MPKVDIDYSNTIFYKIFCKDPTIKELYVGLTTNFVQRKHAHKQSCKNEKASNHNCKLYNTIRNAGGWENWEMEIIAFHNCKDSHEAHKKEQEYFELLGATLNSIEPLPKPKITEPIEKIVKEKTILFCEQCNTHFSHWKAQQTHNDTQKHHKMVSMYNAGKIEMKQKKTPNTSNLHMCNKCDYTCSKLSEWSRHISTSKHINATQCYIEKTDNKHICVNCNKKFMHHSSYYRHKKKCVLPTLPPEKPKIDICAGGVYSVETIIQTQTNLILELVKQNQDFKNLLIQQSNQMMEQNKTMKQDPGL